MQKGRQARVTQCKRRGDSPGEARRTIEANPTSCTTSLRRAEATRRELRATAWTMIQIWTCPAYHGMREILLRNIKPRKLSQRLKAYWIQ